jgi:hypothetical protein
MCTAPTATKSPSTRSLITTMMLFARALSRTPIIRSQVTSITMQNAGRLIRMGTSPTWGAVCRRPWIAGSELLMTAR